MAASALLAAVLALQLLHVARGEIKTTPIVSDSRPVILFEEFGFKKGMTMQDAISAAMIQQAVKGNVKAFVAIRDTIDPKEGGTESGGVRVIVEGKVQDLSEGAPDD